MANTLLTPSVIANAALANLYQNTVMAQLVNRDYEADFQAKVGTTVTVRVPATFTAEDYVQGSGITVQNATETGIPVVLNKFADVSFAVTSSDLTLKIEDFSMQFLVPAMEAISQHIDRSLLALRDDVVQIVGLAGGSTLGISGINAWDADNPRVTIDADRVLNARSVPASQRYVVVGPTTKAQWLSDDLLSKANESGTTDALRDANLGSKVYGFEPYMTQNITGTDEQSVAFHRSAFTLATRPLALPPGAVDAAISNYKGFGLRVVQGYDITNKQTIVSIDCLYGVKTVAPHRAVLVEANAS